MTRRALGGGRVIATEMRLQEWENITITLPDAGFVVVFYGKISGVRIGSTMRVAR